MNSFQLPRPYRLALLPVFIVAGLHMAWIAFCDWRKGRKEA